MDMGRILATSDIVFKYLFGAKSSTELLRQFLNAIQRHAGLGEFPSLEIVNPIGEREFASAKLSVIDIKAQAADGTVVNVEVQVRAQTEYGERSLYYWAKSYTEQILEGEEYRSLMPVVSVSLLNFRLFALKHLDETEGPMIVLLKKNHSIQELAARYRRFEKDSDARIAYEDRMKFIRDQASFLGQAKREGSDEGREEGGRARALEIAKITKLPPEDLGAT